MMKTLCIFLLTILLALPAMAETAEPLAQYALSDGQSVEMDLDGDDELETLTFRVAGSEADGDEHDRPGTSRAFEHHKHEGQREEACALLAYEAHRLEQGREREAPTFCERMQRPQDRRIERGERVVQPRGHQGCFHRTVLSPHGCCGSLAGPSLHETTRASRRQATMRRTGDTVRDLRSRPGVTSAEYGSRRRPSPGAART